MKGRATNLHEIDPDLCHSDKIFHVNVNISQRWSDRSCFMDGEGTRRRKKDRNMRGGGMLERVIWRDAWRAFKEIICDIGDGFHGV